MIYLVTGAGGQLGRDWCTELEKRGVKVTGLNSEKLDISDKVALEKKLREISPDVVVNCAAYTKVDQAENDRTKAFLVNETAVRNLGQLCSDYGIKLIHYSTDYVFPGMKEDQKRYPDGYPEDAESAPINLYGESKLAGEEVLREIGGDWLLIRVSWLCGNHGANFVLKMLELAREREEVMVVDDQIGSPAFTFDVVKKSIELLERNESGIYHVSCSGSLSWADFAEEIFRLSGNNTGVRRVSSEEFKTIAKRPSFSLLSKEKLLKKDIELLDWKKGLVQMLSEAGVLVRDEP